MAEVRRWGLQKLIILVIFSAVDEALCWIRFIANGQDGNDKSQNKRQLRCC